MTNKQLKNLKDTLWTTADQLRVNVNEYLSHVTANI